MSNIKYPKANEARFLDVPKTGNRETIDKAKQWIKSILKHGHSGSNYENAEVGVPEKETPTAVIYGPGGTGKSLLVKIIASICGIPYCTISSGKILDPHLGVSEQTLSDAFDTAIDYVDLFDGFYIIFFDEFSKYPCNAIYI